MPVWTHSHRKPLLHKELGLEARVGIGRFLLQPLVKNNHFTELFKRNLLLLAPT